MFPAEYFRKQDESRDEYFYSFPRKVVHIDDGAIRALTGQFRALLPRGGAVLDLMSSWRSHLPTDVQFRRVVGLGMNAEEMADNPQLDDYVVHNLNHNPLLPFADGEFDAAVCTVSVQYLTSPVAVFTEVARVLKPGGRFIVSFSNRCFPTKAVAIWLAQTDSQHLAPVTRYFELAGRWTNTNTWSKEPGRAPGSWFGGGDPLYLVWAEAAR